MEPAKALFLFYAISASPLTKEANKMRQIILYGVSGASRSYTVLNYFCIYEEFISINTILRQARGLRVKNPDVEHVYAIDNRYGLRRDYIESMKENSIESHYIFKDILEREGMLVI